MLQCMTRSSSQCVTPSTEWPCTDIVWGRLLHWQRDHFAGAAVPGRRQQQLGLVVHELHAANSSNAEVYGAWWAPAQAKLLQQLLRVCVVTMMHLKKHSWGRLLQVCVETMMHLTCTNMPEAKLSDALDKLKAYGIQNVLALRGDPPKGQETFTVVEGGFACALDLVKYIRCAPGRRMRLFHGPGEVNLGLGCALDLLLCAFGASMDPARG